MGLRCKAELFEKWRERNKSYADEKNLLERCLTKAEKLCCCDKKDFHKIRLTIAQLLLEMKQEKHPLYKDVNRLLPKIMRISDRYLRMYKQISRSGDKNLIEYVGRNRITPCVGGRIAGLSEKYRAEAIKEYLKGAEIGKLIKKYRDRQKSESYAEGMKERDTDKNRIQVNVNTSQIIIIL